ncbi:MAG: hypothetical protein COA79_15570 [Planctomycetota bacterium]|nr:MAG: hypothetical protein COA79_15570 [Planctomycetota bacterium]
MNNQNLAKTNLTQMVEDKIRYQIEGGLLKPGGFVAAERILCEDLSVSRVTVRRGLERLVDNGFLERVHNRGYRLPSLEISTNKATAILLLHAYENNEFLSDKDHLQIFKGARTESVKCGRSILIYPVGPEELNESKLNELKKIAGGILVDHPEDSFLNTIELAGIPVVQFHNDGFAPNFDRVSQDDMGGILQSVEYFYNQGYRKIGYLDSSKKLLEVSLAGNSLRRKSGYLMGCDQNGLQPIIANMDLSSLDAESGMKELLEQNMDALIVPHREIAQKVSRVLTEENSKMPVIIWGKYNDKPIENEIGYINWNKKKMGEEAVKRLHEKILTPELESRTILIQAELVLNN